MNKLYILLLIVFVSTNPMFANSFPPKFENVNRFMERLTEEGFSGAVLIAKNGKISSNGYGYADRENKIKATPNTVFSTGSVTKQFTGAAILKLEMQGKLSVQDKISKYFKNVPADKNDITIHQLLTHSAGFPGMVGYDFEFLTKDDYIKRALASELLFKPGEKYEYSNVGFALAAAIIEQVSGKSYEKFLHKNLFVPAGMKNTGYSIPDWSDEQVSVGYKDGERWGKMTEKFENKTEQLWHLKGNGGILSTVEDLYKWHLALKGDKILSREAKEKYFSPHIREYPGEDQFYGYGWVVLETEDRGTLYKHNGGNGRFFADFWRLPKEDTVIIMMTNALEPEYVRLNEEITEMLFEPNYISKLTAKVDKKYPDLQSHPRGKLIQSFIDTVLKGDVGENEKFIIANFHPKLLERFPAKSMASNFTNLSKELKGRQIESLVDKKDRVALNFKDSPLKLVLMIVDDKIAGIDVEN